MNRKWKCKIIFFSIFISILFPEVLYASEDAYKKAYYEYLINWMTSSKNIQAEYGEGQEKLLEGSFITDVKKSIELIDLDKDKVPELILFDEYTLDYKKNYGQDYSPDQILFINVVTFKNGKAQDLNIDMKRKYETLRTKKNIMFAATWARNSYPRVYFPEIYINKKTNDKLLTIRTFGTANLGYAYTTKYLLYWENGKIVCSPKFSIDDGSSNYERILYYLDEKETTENLYKQALDQVQKDTESKPVIMQKLTDDSIKSILDYKQSTNMPSSWAVKSIERAKENNLATSRIFNNYQQNITREEFCEVAIKLYEALAGKAAKLPANNRFIDTNNQEILKANYLGIVSGMNEVKFAPDDTITREQMAVMLHNLLNALKINESTTMEYVFFSDEELISSWAKNSVQYINKIGIMAGAENGKILPQGKVTREQAIVAVNRMFEKFNTLTKSEDTMKQKELDLSCPDYTGVWGNNYVTISINKIQNESIWGQVRYNLGSSCGFSILQGEKILKNSIKTTLKGSFIADGRFIDYYDVEIKLNGGNIYFNGKALNHTSRDNTVVLTDGDYDA